MRIAGCEKVYQEVVSGAKAERPVLDGLLQDLRPGDVLVIWKLDRLGRSLRHLSTVQAIRLLEEHGVGTPDGLLRAPQSVLTRSTVNRYLKQWGFDYSTLTRVPAAVRFQARHSNDCWHFDLSPSDLKSDSYRIPSGHTKTALSGIRARTS